MFEYTQLAQPDPILGLLDVIDSDKRSNKMNLGIGVYKDEYGNTPVLQSVKKAESFILKNEITKNYLNIEGINSFNNSTQKLLFEVNNQSIININRVKTVQTLGGTGALRIAADFLKRNTKTKRIWISNPTWINHENIFGTAGFDILQYPYYNYNTHAVNFDELFSKLSQANSTDVVVLHGCCHNPTGTELNIEQWKILSELSLKNKWLPLFDLAYQGFSDNLYKDLTALHIFSTTHQELIICNSYSKNFNLYNERVGACTIIASDKKIANRILSQLKCIIRSNYSSPPSHGATIVSTILNNHVLRSTWEKELEYIRKHINNIRKLFSYTLQTLDPKKNFNFINQQKGMFSFIGLNKHQSKTLREQFGIYVPNSGRINICGITKKNVNYLCEKLLTII